MNVCLMNRRQNSSDAYLGIVTLWVDEEKSYKSRKLIAHSFHQRGSPAVLKKTSPFKGLGGQCSNWNLIGETRMSP